MLRAVKDLNGGTIHALDGAIGKVTEFLLDDEHWTGRYLVVETGSWLLGRKVLISPIAFDHVEWERYQFHCRLTREQIQNSPDVDTDRPVSRQWETGYYGYYDWPGYWGGMGVWGGYGYPGMLSLQRYDMGEIMPTETQNRAQEHADSHLRSTHEVTGYKISATDGHLGHIDDFIVDEESWTIRYLAVYAGDWWAGKKVLLPPDWIDRISWPDRTVTVEVTRDQIKNAPEWDSSKRIDRTLEERLDKYYASQTH